MSIESETKWMDRSKWVAGPWDDEPEDKVEFRHAGFACLIVRGPAGAWCGYVGVPPGHPAHGVGYALVRVVGEEGEIDLPSVHGGLTYSNGCQGEGGHICHVPAPGEADNVWWLGFDCNHSGDVSPREESMHLRYPEKRDLFEPQIGRPTGWGSFYEYRTVGYARHQTEKLAEQLTKPAPAAAKDTWGEP